MAQVTKPIALDESLNTTEATPRNIADVLAEEIGNLVTAVSRIAPSTTVSWSQIQQSGTKIAEITINGSTTDVYAPTGGGFSALLIITAGTGLTVTASKGGDTYTATETSTGTYEVSVDSAGTWTVSDGSNTATVAVSASTTYYVTLSSVPDGSTVTPTDDVSIWLACGQRSEAYTTLSQVLADSACLSALISDNNAMDYLVRSTTWASDICGDSSAMSYIGLNNYASNTLLADSAWCSAICNSAYFESVLNVKAPIMTSNNTPSGLCFGVAPATGNEAYKAFDGNDSTEFISNAGSTSGDIGYTFPSKAKIYMCKMLTNTNSEYSPTYTYKLQSSDDNFTTINDITGEFTVTYNASRTPVSTIKVFASAVENFSFRLFKVTTSYRIRVNTLQFYGRADV
jgi:hypothetical protein